MDEEYEFEQPTQAELEKCLAHVRYTQHIDKVYRNLKDKTNVAMHRLEPQLRSDPEKFDHDFMNLKSYMDDLDAEEAEKRARKSFRLEQLPQ